MPEQILATKLHIPSPRLELVPRPHLVQRLNEGLTQKLTLISAPAGFGKTTLLSQWIPNSPHCVTWLSLDEGDHEITRFWSHFIASLQRLHGDLGSSALALLHAQKTPQINTVLTALINDLAAFPDSFASVLDDYHTIDSKAVDNSLAFLLKHLPAQMHLVIASREDPSLPLSRYRILGQLNELRISDLRFTPAETAAFLNQVMGLGLSAEDIAALETRTEGWIAGLQLAAFSMRGKEDVHGFVRTFAGDNRYIVDYLVEEVLQNQSELVRDFLLQTSILDRLSGSLCDAVTGQEGSSALLDNLVRSNLFVIPLDDQRHWFRYHHLFSDVLRAHLMTEQPDHIPTLHKRASVWCKKNGLLSDAIRHATAAGDIEQAASLVELAWPEMESNRQTARWLVWAKAIPDKIVRARPVLSAGYAWALLDRGKLEAADTRLRDAERWLNLDVEQSKHPKAPSDAMVVVDKEAFQLLPATIAAARAYHALALGDVPATLSYARQALNLFPQEDHLRRGTSASLMALASLSCGDLEAAGQSLTEAMTSFQMAGNTLFAITGANILAEIRIRLGRLHQAFDTYQQFLQLAEGQGKTVLWGTADLHTGLSELLREQNDLETAAQHLLRSQELGEPAILPRWRFRWYLAQARIKKSQADLDSAFHFLEEAERHYVRGPVPDVRPIAALKAQIWVAQGRLADALAWVHEQGLSPDAELSFLHEFEYTILARLLIAQYESDRNVGCLHEALRLLERLLEAAEAGKRVGSMIELLALQAIAYEAEDNITSALAQLSRALILAEPEGYVRVFIDEGPPMARLLAEASARGMMTSYTGTLLSAYKEDERMRNAKDLSSSAYLLARPQALSDSDVLAEPETLPAQDLLVEPLSRRELEVLKLVAQGLSNRQVSERLFLAESTVKGYTRTIYGKLQVHRRTEAVAHARELGLL